MVECRDRCAKATRIAADLIERYEPHIAVESRIFVSLGHHRAGHLLKMHRHPQHLGRPQVRSAVPRTARQNLVKKIENARVDGMPTLSRLDKRPFDVAM